ncbi:alginate lyase family protein [Paenibacillus campi]|uniref:alginate lyase family protein n=1 Tax=Paenibacillus campi TaxID=3106031 RepID=UPI002AFEA561|nr:alginate lyase family protein [Paenibacillus sp. SGZ-1009]
MMNGRTYYLTTDELARAAIAYRQHYPQHAADSMQIADQACDNLFMVPYTNDLTRWIAMGDPVDWLYNPSLDPEFTWGINRHWHMLELGKAYLLTGEDKHVATYMRHFRSWCSQNPVPQPPLSYEQATFFQLPGPWRLLETGLRVQSWISTYAYMQRSELIDAAFTAELLEALEQHAVYLTSYLGQTEINHAMMHMQGLFMIGVFYSEHPRAPYWRQLATERLQLCQYDQIGPEGIQSELTTHYHDASIEMFGTPYLLGRLSGFPFPAAYGQQLHRMTTFTLAMIRPDNRSTAIGDSEWVSNGRARVAMLGGILDDEHLLVRGEVSPDFLWMFGAEQFEKYAALQQPELVDAEGIDFPQTGYYMLKSPGQHLFFDAAPMGGAHGHADALNIEWYWQRQLIFVDPGRYTYEEGYWRHYFKSTAAHNTIVIDGQDQTPYISTQAWAEPAAACQTLRRKSDADYELVDATHDGYMRLDDPVQHRRWLMLGKQVPLLIIVEWVEAHAVHDVHQRFQLHPDAVVSVLSAPQWVDNEEAVTEQMDDALAPAVQLHYPQTELSARMYWTTVTTNDGEATGQSAQPLQITCQEGWVSPIYGQKQPTSVIDAGLHANGSIGIATVVIPDDHTSDPANVWVLDKFELGADRRVNIVLYNDKAQLCVHLDEQHSSWSLS